MDIDGSESGFTRLWNRSIDEGRIQATTILEEEITLCGVKLPAGRPIHYGLRAEGGRWVVFARAAIGPQPGTDWVELEPQWESKTVGEFTAVYAEIRTIRPVRKDNPPIGRQPDLDPRSAENCPFECKVAATPLSILRREPLMDVELGHRTYALLHNAMFIDPLGHALLVPTMWSGGKRCYPHRGQTLTMADMEDMALFQERNPDLIGFFNSRHAGSSVDHIHIQFVHRGDGLAIEKASRTRLGGMVTFGENYPARGLAFGRGEPAAAVFEWVQRCQSRGIPFNLIVTRAGYYLIPRDRDREVVPEFPSGVMASLDVAGRLIFDDRRAYDEITPGRIASALRSTTVKDLGAFIR